MNYKLIARVVKHLDDGGIVEDTETVEVMTEDRANTLGHQGLGYVAEGFAQKNGYNLTGFTLKPTANAVTTA